MDGGSPVVIERDYAKTHGLTRFFTGARCSHGHLAERYVSSGGCVQCAVDAKRVDLEAYRTHLSSPLTTSTPTVIKRAKPVAVQPAEWWCDDGGARRETVTNEVSGRVSKMGWVTCLSRSDAGPHRFFSSDVSRYRICDKCKGTAV